MIMATVEEVTAAPIEEISSPDLLQLTLTNTNNKSPPSDDDAVTIAQFSPIVAAPFTPNPSFSEKRKRVKPAKFKFPSLKKESNKKRIYNKVARPRGTNLSLGKKKAATEDGDAAVPISPTMIRAQEVQSSLGKEYPTFIKLMLRSHVVTCFWMGLPLSFCRSYLPEVDSSIIAEDENGEQSILKYIAYRFGLSAGWRAFSVDHKLREGDVLIFQLVNHCKFKIHIVRTNDAKEADGALGNLSHEVNKEPKTPAMLKTCSKLKGRKRASSLSLTMVQKKQKRSKLPTELCNQAVEHSGVGSEVQGGSLIANFPVEESNMVKKKQRRSKLPTQLSNQGMENSEVASEVQGGSPKTILSVEELTTFKDFHILVNNTCIDSELSEEIRLGYYNLCTGRNEILHDGVPDGTFHKLVAGMIGETVSIANAVRNCKLTTRKKEFDQWHSSLKSFELMGMKVGFLRKKVHGLATFAIESVPAKKYVEAKKEQHRNADEIKTLESKLAELYESNRKIDTFVGGLKEKAEKEFQEKVDAPW